MSLTLERKFADWDEYGQELESNLKNFGLFIPGQFQAQMREKLEVKIFLPAAQEPVPAKAEVVAVLPAGVALHLENGPEILKRLNEVKQALKSAAEEPASAPEQEEAERDEPLPEETEPESLETAEEIEQRVSLSGSDYSNLFQVVRGLSRGEKIKLAKRGNRRYISILIQEGDKQLIRFVIQNPHLSAVEVLQLLKNPQLTTENIQELARNPGFGQNEEVRYQIVIHPKTPLPTAISLLASLNQRQLGLIAKSKHMKHQIKSKALKLLLKRQTDTF